MNTIMTYQKRFTTIYQVIYIFEICYRYVNDIEAAVSCQLILYADDSALLVSGRDDRPIIAERLGNELSSLNGSWSIISSPSI